jgi:hypothetical protein
MVPAANRFARRLKSLRGRALSGSAGTVGRQVYYFSDETTKNISGE